MSLHITNNSQYFQLKVVLSNNMKKGIDNYPKTIVKTMRLLTDYVPPLRLQSVSDSDGEELAFIQVRRVRAKSNAGIVVGRTSRASAPS